MRYSNANGPAGYWNMDFNEINVSPSAIANLQVFNPSPPKDAFRFSDTDWNSKQFFFGFYEYDWYVSQLEGIINDCTNNLNTSIAVRMVFDDEWFFKWCGSGTSLMPSSGSTLLGENTKSKFILKRN
jgi:hypothetical protein